MISRLLLSAILSVASLTAQSAELQDFAATYMIEKYDIIIGVGDYHLEQDAGKAHFFMRSKLTGLAALFRNDRAEEDSWLEKDHQGRLQLMHYRYQQSGSKHNRNTDLTVAWTEDCTHGRVSGSHAGKPVSFDVKATVRDALSFQLSLMQDAASERALSYAVLNKNELKSYIFTRNGNETLSLANQNVETLIVERKTDDRITRLWLAKQFQYTPVKIEQIKDGTINTRMVIDTLTQAGQKKL